MCFTWLIYCILGGAHSFNFLFSFLFLSCFCFFVYFGRWCWTFFLFLFKFCLFFYFILIVLGWNVALVLRVQSEPAKNGLLQCCAVPLWTWWLWMWATTTTTDATNFGGNASRWFLLLFVAVVVHDTRKAYRAYYGIYLQPCSSIIIVLLRKKIRPFLTLCVLLFRLALQVLLPPNG